ncbi:MAG: hypothetical protein MJ080_04545 [Clostridia bacterium]|nr:hypothetical protein [Clostridia bacterium]
MKNKVLSVVLAVVIMAAFCGCSGYREPDSSYIVTALGFDADDEITVSAEVVTAGGSERSNEPYSEILTGRGDTPEDAVFSLNSQISKILMFDHCTAVIVGKTLSQDRFEDVIEYGLKLKELNFSVYMTVCDNAADLLNNSKSISVARGFDIASNIRETKKDTGIDYENRFFETFEAYKSKEYYSMPFLTLNDKRIIIKGEQIYKNKKEIATLSNEESLMYSFVKNNNRGGKIYLEQEYAQVTQSRFKMSESGIKATLYIKNNSKDFAFVFKQKTENFLSKYKDVLNFKSDKLELAVKDGV